MAENLISYKYEILVHKISKRFYVCVFVFEKTKKESSFIKIIIVECLGFFFFLKRKKKEHMS